MKPIRLLSAFLALFLLLSLCACTGGTQTPPDTDGTTAPVEQYKPFEYQRVVIIGVDGAGAFFDDTDTPNVDRIFANGATSDKVITSNPTISAQCWGSLLTGTPADVHKITNDSISDVANPDDGDLPTIFRLTHEKYPDATLASFSDWSPINKGIIEQGIGVYFDSDNDVEMVPKILSYLDTADPKLLFMQFDSVDHAGHSTGFGSETYLKRITLVDGLIGQVYDKLASLGRTEDTLFIVTADHGGTMVYNEEDGTYGGGHGGLSDNERYIFFGAAGASIAHTTLSGMFIRDIPAILAHALSLGTGPQWDSFVPAGLFEGYQPAARPLDEDDFSSVENTATPAEGTDGYIGNYLDLTKVGALLTFDGSAKDEAGKVTCTEDGKIYYTDGFYGESARVSKEGTISIAGIDLTNADFSVGMWVMPNAIPDDCPFFTNLDLGNSNTPAGVKFYFGGKIDVAAGALIQTNISSDFPQADFMGKWVHIALTVDRATNTEKLYVNFKCVAETALHSSIKDKSFASDLPFTLGWNKTGDFKEDDAIDFNVDDLIWYNGLLTDADLARLGEYYGIK